jgi:hypothetical protein
MPHAPPGELDAWEPASGEPNSGIFGLIVSYSTQWFRRLPPNVCAQANVQLSGRTRNSGANLVHAVALVHESLVVAVYPDNAGSGKLKSDEGVDSQSQRYGEDHDVQPRALVGVAHVEPCDERAE